MGTGIRTAEPRERDLVLVLVIALTAFALGFVADFWFSALLAAVTWFGLRRWRKDAKRALMVFAIAYAAGFLVMFVLSAPVSGEVSGGPVEAISVESSGP